MRRIINIGFGFLLGLTIGPTVAALTVAVLYVLLNSQTVTSWDVKYVVSYLVGPLSTVNLLTGTIIGAFYNNFGNREEVKSIYESKTKIIGSKRRHFKRSLGISASITGFIFLLLIVFLPLQGLLNLSFYGDFMFVIKATILVFIMTSIFGEICEFILYFLNKIGRH